jgi:SAM-dependent methyltransferase
MTDIDPDADARRLARESAADDPTGWFERLYAAAAAGQATVPWDRGAVHPILLEWAQTTRLAGRGDRAVVVGCGTGENAEFLSDNGFHTVAFDISATAVQTAQARFPQSDVEYLVADLLDPPAAWQYAFDLVVEVFTVQSLPPQWHPLASMNTGSLVKPGGTLLVLAAVAERAPEPNTGPPWPLTREEITAFTDGGLDLVQLDEVPGPADPSHRRWRAEYRRRPATTT